MSGDFHEVLYGFSAGVWTTIAVYQLGRWTARRRIKKELIKKQQENFW